MPNKGSSAASANAEFTAGIEPAYSYADLDRLGEGSRWTIDRGVRDGTYPKPDLYVGRHPRWLATSVNRHRQNLIAKCKKGVS